MGRRVEACPSLDGDRKGLNAGSGGIWNDATVNAFPDWLQINFAGVQAIGEIDVFTQQDNYPSPVEPTSALTFAQYGLGAFQVQYWHMEAFLRTYADMR
jgi:hypothetical protein